MLYLRKRVRARARNLRFVASMSGPRLACWTLSFLAIMQVLACAGDPTDPAVEDQDPPGWSGGAFTPEDGAVDVIDRVLTWPAAVDEGSGIASYRVLLGHDDGSEVEIEAGLERSCSTGVLQLASEYRWRVVARDGEGNEGQSPVFRFTTSANPPRFAAIEPGTFLMGSPDDEVLRSDHERQHEVTLNNGFWIQRTEVTNQQYASMAQWALDRGLVMMTASGVHDAVGQVRVLLLDMMAAACEISYFDGVFTVDDGRHRHPVKSVTWFGAATYCNWLSIAEGLAPAYDHGNWSCGGGQPYEAAGYRLPTEAEWEFACRAMTTTPFHRGDCLESGLEANYRGYDPYPDCEAGDYRAWTEVTAWYPANLWDLHDMHGNVREWCQDWFGQYPDEAVIDPFEPLNPAQTRVVRGGSWSVGAGACRSAARAASLPSHGDPSTGFRPARTRPR